jgi:hypothetical protein
MVDIGLPHSAAKASTACPATIVPIEQSDEYDLSGRGYLRVRFDGTEKWEGIGNSPMPGTERPGERQATKCARVSSSSAYRVCRNPIPSRFPAAVNEIS